VRARPALLVVTALAALALAAPATAPASDVDVITAWGSEDKALDASGTALNAGLKRAERTRFRRVGSVVATLKKMEALTRGIRTRVAAQQPSTQSGIAARRQVLASLAGFASSLKSLRLSMKSASRGRVLAARRYLRRSKAQADAAEAAARQAIALFQQGQREAQPAPPPPSGQQPPPSDGTQQPPPPPSDGTQQQPPPSDGTQQPPPSDGGSGGTGDGSGGTGDGSGGGSGDGGDDGSGDPGPGPIDFPDIPLP
jgi:uncharacterized membrane protein YgcG